MMTPVTKLVMLATAWSANEKTPWCKAVLGAAVRLKGKSLRRAGKSGCPVTPSGAAATEVAPGSSDKVINVGRLSKIKPFYKLSQSLIRLPGRSVAAQKKGTAQPYDCCSLAWH